MPRANTKASYIDVTMHQAARRDALIFGQAPIEEPITDVSLRTFLLTMTGIVCALVGVLWYVTP